MTVANPITDDGADLTREAATASVVQLAERPHRLATPIRWQGNPVRIQGTGPGVSATGEPAGVVLTVPPKRTDPDGSVTTYTGLVGTSDTGRNLELQSVTFLGTDRTGIGADLGAGAQNNRVRTRGLNTQSLGVGLRINSSILSAHYDYSSLWCKTGIEIADNVTSQQFYSPMVEYCDTGAVLRGGSGITFFGGCFEGGKVGVNLCPDTPAGLMNVAFNGTHFEGNANGDFILDSTCGPIGCLTFSHCLSWTAGAVSVPGPITNVINGVVFNNCDFGGLSLYLDQRFHNVTIQNGRWGRIRIDPAIKGRVTIVGNPGPVEYGRAA